jgi:hypothetical protein
MSAMLALTDVDTTTFRLASDGLVHWNLWLRDPRVISFLVSAIGAAMAMVAAISLIRRDRRRHGPALRSLCRAGGLTRAQRRLLVQMAQSTRVAEPAALLISQGCFDHAAVVFCSLHSDNGGFSLLRSQLFPDAQMKP